MDDEWILLKIIAHDLITVLFVLHVSTMFFLMLFLELGTERVEKHKNWFRYMFGTLLILGAFWLAIPDKSLVESLIEESNKEIELKRENE